jgi:pyridoxine 5-phosphate synthase
MLLGVNIDHIATVRNARGSNHPDILFAAKHATKCGADSITIHLREDRRHIIDSDVVKICRNNKILTNLEISLNKEILKIALKNKPNYICLVPENRKEITTEGGLNLSKNRNKIKNIVSQFKDKKIRTSLFIDPKLKDIKIAKNLNVDCIELHTGRISELIKNKKDYIDEYIRIKKCCELGKKLGLKIHAGHGLDYKSTKILCEIKEIEEFNIGHFIVGESIINGLNKTIKNFKKITNK